MKKTIIFLVILIIFSFGLGIFPYFLSDFYPPSPDSTGLACGIKNILEQEKLSLDNFYLVFDTSYCYGEKPYPLEQIYGYSVSKVSGLPPFQIVSWLTIFIFVLIPIIIFFLSKDVFKKSFLAFLAGILSTTSLAMARSLVLTPQNLFGYLLIIFIVWTILKYEKSHKKTYLFISGFSFLTLALFHQLSFVIAFISVIIYLFFRIKSKKHFAALFLSMIIAFFIVSYYSVGSFNIFKLFYFLAKEGSSLGHLSSEVRPAWDWPQILGYHLFILGIFGIIVSFIGGSKSALTKFPQKGIFFSLFFGAILLANTHRLGLNILPTRIIAFLFLPLTFFAVFGLRYIFQKLRRQKMLVFLFFLAVVFIIISSTVHFIIFALDDYKGFGEEILPTPQFIAAMKWLNEHAQENDTILTTTRKRPNKFSTYIPYFYKGNLIAYPLFDFKHLNEFVAINPKVQARLEGRLIEPEGLAGKIVKIFYKKTDEEIKKEKEKNEKYQKQLYEIFLMLNEPASREAKDFMDKYNVRYVITWRNSHEDQIYHQKATDFKVSFKNDLLKIYERKNEQQ